MSDACTWLYHAYIRHTGQIMAATGEGLLAQASSIFFKRSNNDAPTATSLLFSVVVHYVQALFCWPAVELLQHCGHSSIQEHDRYL